MGKEVSKVIDSMISQQGISVINNSRVTGMHGDYKVERVHFRKNKSTEMTQGENGAW